MPARLAPLEAAATRAFNGYAPGQPNGGNVRSGVFIREFQTYCEGELQHLGLPPAPIVSQGRPIQQFRFATERPIVGAHYIKSVDLTVQSDTSGPLLSLSLKSMLSSVAKNVNNRWEEAIGDASNLHVRFPMLPLGFLMILPAMSSVTANGQRVPEPLIDAAGQPTPLAESVVRKLAAARGRRATTELPSYYEEVAVMVFEYPVQPGNTARLHPTFPSPASGLRIEPFFDNLMERFSERHPHLV
ncbi:MAG: hypothetical protein V4617_08175 [Gemmatimonadota bacterium]